LKCLPRRSLFPNSSQKTSKKSFPILKSSSIYTILTVVAPITTIPIQRISSKMPVPQETSPYKSFLTRGHYPFSGMRNTAHLMASGLFDKGIAKHVSDNNLSVVIKSDYLDSNSVFFTLSIELCFALGIPNAFVVMVTMPFWMILSSFEKLWIKLLDKDMISRWHIWSQDALIQSVERSYKPPHSRSTMIISLTIKASAPA